MKQKTHAVRRQHVLDSAITVFADKGFRGATIRDIAIAAGVSDGTIYNLFENKAALLQAILAGAEPSGNAIGFANPPPIHDMLRARWAAIGPDSLAMLRVILSEALIDHEFRGLYRQTLLTPAIDQLAELLATQPLQVGDPASSPHDARLLTAMFLGLVMLRLLGDDMTERRGDALLDRLSAFIEQGFTRLAPRSGAA